MGKKFKTICSCGGTVHNVDHGTWIGYRCSKCGTGGSKNKKNIKPSFSYNKKRKW